MIIKLASQIITEIIKFEKKKINEFEVQITHAPTIGKQYEGLTIKALDRVIPDDLNIKVISGFIKNSKNQLSGQIDCMICFGEGDLVPGTTDEYIYEIQKVIAVIEIKKNLFTNELEDSHQHLLEVNGLICDHESIPAKHVDIIYTNFAKITGIFIKSRNDVKSLNDDFLEMIYHGLVSQFIMPLRIVIGYNGFSSEKSLRDKFASFISSNPKTKGFGPFSLPDLVICGDNCLTKLNGEPYVPIIENNFLEFFVSSTGHNLKILTEIIFSKLKRYANFDFTEDDEQEPLKYFLGAKLIKAEEKMEWEYTYHSFDPEKLNLENNFTKWQPEFVSKEAHIVFSRLCKKPIDIDSNFFNQAKKEAPDIQEQLLKTRFVAIHNNTIYLITYNLQCVILPTGEFIVADDNHGYLHKWLSENYYNKKEHGA
ncbi:MAG: hypothetical protein JRC93_01165 [Deltaproteobacteria bacterium]|nr:hypothetical protein [Deltaproteobacteria bacterium]